MIYESVFDIGIRTEIHHLASIYGDRNLMVHVPSLVEQEVELHLGPPRQNRCHLDRPVRGYIHLLPGGYVRGKLPLLRGVIVHEGYRYREAEAAVPVPDVNQPLPFGLGTGPSPVTTCEEDRRQKAQSYRVTHVAPGLHNLTKSQVVKAAFLRPTQQPVIYQPVGLVDTVVTRATSYSSRFPRRIPTTAPTIARAATKLSRA